VQFRFPDVAASARDWWLVITASDIDVCDVDPGHDVAVTVTASLRHLIEVWNGDVRWNEAVRAGDLAVAGPERLRRAVPRWFTLSHFAAVPRPA
jgi:hypothetical protein